MRSFEDRDGKPCALRVAAGVLLLSITLVFGITTASAQSSSSSTLAQGQLTADGQLTGPGRGLTKQFEISFMESTIDHHFSALRITELAAGTDTQRSASLSPAEGTAPTPGFPATAAKADLPDLKSLARRNNRMQREEIQTMRQFLKDWYGIDYQPHLTSAGQEMIQLLDSTAAGAAFDHAFYEAFSRHHFTLLDPVNQCLTGSEEMHPDLMRLCRDMWHSQTSDIDQMRRELARHFGIVDFQPFKDPRGQHSGDTK